MMDKRARFIRSRWNFAKVFAPFFTVIILLIAASRLFPTVDGGLADDWRLIPVAIGLALLVWLLAEISRRWFNFMLGEPACKWWWQE